MARSAPGTCSAVAGAPTSARPQRMPSGNAGDARTFSHESKLNHSKQPDPEEDWDGDTAGSEQSDNDDSYNDDEDFDEDEFDDNDEEEEDDESNHLECAVRICTSSATEAAAAATGGSRLTCRRKPWTKCQHERLIVAVEAHQKTLAAAVGGGAAFGESGSDVGDMRINWTVIAE